MQGGFEWLEIREEVGNGHAEESENPPIIGPINGSDGPQGRIQDFQWGVA